MNIAENIAIESKKIVVFFSMGMSCDDLTMRMIASVGKVDLNKVRTGQLCDAEWSKITSAINRLAETHLFFDDTASLDLVNLKVKMRTLKKNHGQLGLIILDYLQLIQPTSGSNNMREQIVDIFKSLKCLAEEFNVPIIVISELDNNSKHGINTSPVLSDIQYFEHIENYSDVVMFVHREGIYKNKIDSNSTAEITVAKQRNGGVGAIKLDFIEEYTRFESVKK